MRNRGFTIVELVVVLGLAAVAMAIALPRLRLSSSYKVRSAATQLARDLEFYRTRALGTKRTVRVFFDVPANRYTGFLDDNGDKTFAESVAERQALGNLSLRLLDADILFGRGTASLLPGDPGTGAVTFASTRVDFGPNGVTTPFGTSGTVYVVSRTDSKAVAAVSVTGAGSFKVWRYNSQAGVWQ